jgi:acetoin utilization deacetylase AcuC-like enzyme
MEKYDLLPEQLLYEGTIDDSNLFSPEPLEESLVLRTHSDDYWKKLKHGTINKSEERRMGFPYSKQLVHRELVIANGTIQAARFALEYGVAMNIAGGTHHAFFDRGEGFCLLNDIAIASNYLLDNGLASQIFVIDLDVHQGNGTASIFKDCPDVFTFSMHGARNYPMQKEKSDCDVELPDGINDEEYLSALENHLPPLIDEFEPDFIFFQSGVDILATDNLGRLGVSQEGCKFRDRFVLNLCKRNGIPVAAVMGGGYSKKISDIVEAHANTYRIAQDIYF